MNITKIKMNINWKRQWNRYRHVAKVFLGAHPIFGQSAFLGAYFGLLYTSYQNEAQAIIFEHVCPN